jgi:hypothetical protein
MFWQARSIAPIKRSCLPGAGLFDLIYGPEPLTPADEKRDADRKELEGLPVIDFGAFMTHANEEPNTELNRS